jgi:hypothetical protein
MIKSADQNLVRWGLHELDGGGQVVYDAGSSGHSSVTESSRDSSETEAIPYVESVHHAYLDLVPPLHLPSTADDAVIAQALQEEFHKLAAAEQEAGLAGSVNEHLQVKLHLYALNLQPLNLASYNFCCNSGVLFSFFR